MNRLQKTFYAKTIAVFDFLENDYGYRRLPKAIESEKDYRDAEFIVRYLGNAVAIDISWHYASAAINMIFTELLLGKMPERRIFWGEISTNARAASLYAIVQVRKGTNKDFLLGDIDSVTMSKIKKREELILTKMEYILQNLKSLALECASDVINGDLSIFSSAMKYQENNIKKRNYRQPFVPH